MKSGVGGGGAISGGGGTGGVSSTKRRWRGFVIAVLGLVILSMLVPLVFLLGFHNAFHSTGFPSEPSEEQRSTSAEPVIEHAQEVFQIEFNGTQSNETPQVLHSQEPLGLRAEHVVQRTSSEKKKVNTSSPVPVPAIQQPKIVDESEKLCELRFGSYCLWRREHKEDMMDSMVKKLKDRLFVARAYFPSIAKLPVLEKLSKELRQNIQDFERMLSEATTDSDLPPQVEKKLVRMEAAISSAKTVSGVDCNNVDKKFRQLVDLTEDEATFHTKQSAFLYQLAVHTMPKSLHCLSMRLTVEYFHSAPEDVEESVRQKYTDPELYHYVVFSNNILASSVVINSTVAHAKESKKLVFHVLTDRQNYYAMKLWFSRKNFKAATVQVLNIEDYKSENSDGMPGLSMPEELRVTFQSSDDLTKMHYVTRYISLFSQSHYLLPEIFKDLEKIVVLEDDILVQKDLSTLWSINMNNKVNGAVEFCDVRLGRLQSYLGSSSFDEGACTWMSGLNIIDLSRWRELNLTGKFRKLVHKLESEGKLNEGVASRASLLTFHNLVYPLDLRVLSGLGHDYGIDLQAVRNSAVLHYNGNMKPWLDIGIPKYRKMWFKLLDREDQFLSACNVVT